MEVTADGWTVSIQPTLQLLHYAQTELSRGQTLSSPTKHLLPPLMSPQLPVSQQFDQYVFFFLTKRQFVFVEGCFYSTSTSGYSRKKFPLLVK